MTFLRCDAGFTSIFDTGRFLGALAPQGIQVEDAHRIRLFPALFALEDAVAVPPDWSFLVNGQKDGGRLVVDGTAINPYLIRQGRFQAIRPTRGERCALTLPLADPVDEPVLFIGGDCMDNYYHWLVDFYPRLVLFRRLGARLRVMGVRRVALRRDPPAFVTALLARLDIGEDEIRWIDGDRATPFRSLVLLSNLSQYGYLHPQGVGILRDAFQAAGRGHRRLYVSRRDATARRITNEAGLAAALESAGFETVVPSRLDFESQARLFAEASVIVGPHGAGLTNLLFAPPGATLVELWPSVRPLRHFSMLARALGHSAVLLRADGIDGNDHNADFHIDPARVLAALPGSG